MHSIHKYEGTDDVVVSIPKGTIRGRGEARRHLDLRSARAQGCLGKEAVECLRPRRSLVGPPITTNPAHYAGGGVFASGTRACLNNQEDPIPKQLAKGISVHSPLGAEYPRRPSGLAPAGRDKKSSRQRGPVSRGLDQPRKILCC